MQKNWFVIVNPVSGNGAAKKKWPLIKKELKNQEFLFDYSITEHKNHALVIINDAVKKARHADAPYPGAVKAGAAPEAEAAPEVPAEETTATENKE